MTLLLTSGPTKKTTGPTPQGGGGDEAKQDHPGRRGKQQGQTRRPQARGGYHGVVGEGGLPAHERGHANDSASQRFDFC